MRALVVSEFYPRRHDPVLGVWAHRQALATRAAGVDVEVIVLHRLVPPLSALRSGPRALARALRDRVTHPLRTTLDGLPVTYAPFVSPPRGPAYAQWGAWAAPALALAARGRRFDVVHAHNAVPAAQAVLRARLRAPLLVSVHGGDVLHTARHGRAGSRAVGAALSAARLVLANSAGVERLARAAGARDARVVHLGADVPPQPRTPPQRPTVAVVGHLIARKRHADVLRAAALLPDLRVEIVGDGPERGRLRALVAQLGIADRVRLLGQLEPAAALARAQAASLLVLPSTDEAFGVAYVEAMAAGVPAIGARGEPGPEEIAAAGGGIALVDAGDVQQLARRIGESLADLDAAGASARANVIANFTWERCGAQTARAYEDALR